LGVTADLHLEKNLVQRPEKSYRYNLFFNISNIDFSIFLEFFFLYKNWFLVVLTDSCFLFTQILKLFFHFFNRGLKLEDNKTKPSIRF